MLGEPEITTKLMRQTLPSAHPLLRRATRRLHHRIDSTSVLAALTISGVTPDLYQIAMESLIQAYEQIDSVFLQAAHLCPNDLAPYTPRTPILERDLAALGQFHRVRFKQLKIRLEVPGTAASYLGMRYVVEGAQLGSRFIYKHLRSAFGDEIHRFGTFWTPGCFAEGTWPSLLQCLDRVDSRKALADAVRAARLTFWYMQRCLCVSTTEAI